MESVTVRVNRSSRDILRDIAALEGLTMQEILDKAIEYYRRKQFLEKANAAYEALRSNPEAWQEEQKERAAWETILSDGLE